MPKVVQMCVSVQDPSAESFRILTDEGQIWEQVNDDLLGVGPWKRVELPWEKPAEVPFSECKNPDCPIGCPDSHAAPFAMRVHDGLPDETEVSLQMAAGGCLGTVTVGDIRRLTKEVARG